MIWYLAGLVVLLQIYFWGIGLTLLALPRRWRPFWPGCAAMTGLGLQSAVVWFAAHTTLRGTDSYAVLSLLLPAGLLAAAAYREGLRRFAQLIGGARRWWVLGAVMAISLGVQTAPFAAKSKPLTSAALSSCDAADYAGGARVLKEFSCQDRSGFLGVPEAVATLSVDNFFDFWLRLNHFTPSALIALNATLLGRQPFELTSLLGAVLMVLNLPGVFWLGRSVFRFRPAACLAVTAIYGCSPIVGYAVFQVALGQLLAAPAVALLGWVGWHGYRAAGSWRRLAGYLPMLLIGDWLLLGSYNFFVVFAFLPLAAYIGGRSLWTLQWRRAVRWGAWLAGSLVLSTFLFPERVLGLAERFYLFNKTPFGWPIPGFYPDGWYGSFEGVQLHPQTSWRSLAYGVACLGALGWALTQRTRRNLLVAASVLPIMAGYALLLWKDAHYHRNASYDAFKLFTVFYPGILLSLCLWLQAASRRPMLRWAAALLWLIVLGVNWQGAARFNAAMEHTPLVVQKSFPVLSSIEQLPGVESLNVCLQSNWDILWANYFLLHKPQYFPITEYEARHGSALKGDWDLRDHYLDVLPSDPKSVREIDPHYYLVNRRSPEFAELKLGAGWYGPEHGARQIWSWSNGSPEVMITNPEPQALKGTLRFAVRSGQDGRQLAVAAGGRRIWEGTIDRGLRTVENVPVILSPGSSTLRLETGAPAPPTARDFRALTFALYGMQVRLEPYGPGH